MLLVLAGCSSHVEPTTPSVLASVHASIHASVHASLPAPAPAPPTTIAVRGDASGLASCLGQNKPYDEVTLREHMEFLASPDLAGRAPGTEGDRATRALIVAQFRCLGLLPAGDQGGFEQAFDATANVVGYIPGTDSTDVILIGAHHDHLGTNHPGANDNASGIVALLAIAKALRQQPAASHRTIGFVAFGDEEQGMVGSRYFAEHAPSELATERIVYAINLDMVGSYRSRGAVYVMGTFPKLPARAILDRLARLHPKLSMGLGGRGERSDHAPFCALGIPYVFFWTPDARCYHETCDTLANVDVPHLAEIATVAGELATELAKSDLDLAASRDLLGCAGIAPK